MDYMFNATSLIAAAFDNDNIRFRVTGHDDSQEDVEAGFAIDNGPFVLIKFMSNDNNNDVAVRLFGLINSVKKDRRMRVVEACNELNSTYRFVRFTVDHDNDVNMEYDFPLASTDDAIGPMCVEIFRRMMAILERAYPFLMKALHTEEDLQFEKNSGSDSLMDCMRRLLIESGAELSGDESAAELLEMLKALRDKLRCGEDDE